MMKTLVLGLALALAACGGKKPQTQNPDNTGGGGSGSGDGSGSAAPQSCTADTDCGEGMRCDTCPSTCPPGTEVCAAVCGPAVCVTK
jgi:hypothetical protein